MKSAATPVRLDRVHVGVRDRRHAAARYRRVLQLRTTDDYRRHGDTREPLVLSGDGSRTHLALVVGADVPRHKRTHIGTVAFRVPGRAYLRLVARAPSLDLCAQGAAV
jgi:catechol-2,3-dioxygenase